MEALLFRIWPENTKPTFNKGKKDKANRDLLWNTIQDAEEDFRFGSTEHMFTNMITMFANRRKVGKKKRITAW